MLLIFSKLLASLFVDALLAIVYAGYDALTIWKRNKLGLDYNLNHRSRHALRLSHCLALAWCTFGPTWLALAHCLVLISAFFLVFDPALNDFRSLSRYYVSASNAWDSAWIRRFGPRAGRIMFRLELAGFVLTIGAFILTAVFTR